MRNLMIPMALVAGLAFGSTAFAATAPAVHPALKPAATAPAVKPALKPVAAATPAKTQSVSAGKTEACAKTWSSQKAHVGARDAFMKACVAKG